MVFAFKWNILLLINSLSEIYQLTPNNHPHSHYNSHQDTIHQARKQVEERLQEYGVNDNLAGNELLQTSVGNNDPLCTVSCVK